MTVQARPHPSPRARKAAVLLPGGMRRESGREGALAGRAAGAPRGQSRSRPAPGTPAGHGQRPAASGPAFSGNMTAGRGEPGKGGRRGCPAGREGATWRRSLREWQQSDQQRGWSGEARLWQPLCAARQPCEPAPLGNSCARPARPPLRRSPPRTGYFWSAWARQNLNRGSAAGLQRAWLRRSEKASQPAQEHLTVHLPLAEGSGVRLPARPPARRAAPAMPWAGSAFAPRPRFHPSIPQPAWPPRLATLLREEQTGVLGHKTGFGISILPSCNSGLHPLRKLPCLFESKPLYPDSGDVRPSPACLNSCCHTVP